jgi:hypothetical protein
MPKIHIRITHIPSSEVIAEGPVGTRITPFEGNYYIQKKYLRAAGFKPPLIPGLCFDISCIDQSPPSALDRPQPFINRLTDSSAGL